MLTKVTVQTLVLAGIICSGCIRTEVINLTPRALPRSQNDLYLFEAQWKSNLRTVIPESLTGYVIYSTNIVPMRPVPGSPGHWEAWVNVDRTKRRIYYHYKFLYQYRSIPTARPDSTTTPTYVLEILDTFGQ